MRSERRTTAWRTDVHRRWVGGNQHGHQALANGPSPLVDHWSCGAAGSNRIGVFRAGSERRDRAAVPGDGVAGHPRIRRFAKLGPRCVSTRNRPGARRISERRLHRCRNRVRHRRPAQLTLGLFSYRPRRAIGHQPRRNNAKPLARRNPRADPDRSGRPARRDRDGGKQRSRPDPTAHPNGHRRRERDTE